MKNYFTVAKFLLVFPVVGIVVVTVSTLFPFIVGKYVLFRTSVDLSLIVFLLGLLFQDAEGIMLRRVFAVLKRPLVVAVSIFVAIFLLASFFAFDPMMAFWSNFERGEGGLQLLHLWLFFVLLVTLFREKKDWRMIFWWTIVGGALSGIYGIFAGLGVSGFIGALFSDPGFRFQGSIGNPAYVAAYAIFLLFYVFYLLSSEYRRRLMSPGGIILLILGAGFLGMFFSAATRGAFLGLIAAVLVFLLYVMYSHKKWRRWMIVASLLIVAVVGSFVYFKDTTFVKSIPGSRIFDISFKTETFQDRATMWKIALDGFRDQPLLGWGPENYLNIFDRRFNIEYFAPSAGFGAWFDRAHSVYFDYLAETGILGFLSFLSIFVVFYWQFIRFSKKQFSLQGNSNRVSYVPILERGLLSAILVAYLVQGLVLFDVYTIYINLYLLLAFSAFTFQETLGTHN
ncbi:MAG: O-antigen ligase family protein [Candidatus Jorgensenbacteria bacterium]|nr:O-antigen ligase family protein [Candidatus Jorgensenbacteria bacterium]